MDTPHVTNPSVPSRVESQSFRHLIGSWYTPRRGLILAGLAIAVGGLALGWNWLAAIGVAPLILSLAPCAAMCALGICVMARASSPGTKKDSAAEVPPAHATED